MRLLTAAVVLLVGIVMLPGIVSVLDALQVEIEALPGVTDFEIGLWGLVPYMLFVFVLIAVVYSLVGRGRRE